ncbi:MAG: hypothetical protein A4E62_01921 [Syntrophorhabdus sp. PtaU1.Bin002]|nr:MAG: hypothetical protein A4E62_01921 [Syntrophorhabdus sp. PtaU1.Bin002]
MMPFMKATGMKMTTMARVVADTARPISDVAKKEASLGVIPSSMCLWIFSMTMIASSIRIPMDRERASMDILLKVNPKAFMIAKVEITEAGMAKALMIVVLKFLRKRRTARMANMPP